MIASLKCLVTVISVIVSGNEFQSLIVSGTKESR